MKKTRKNDIFRHLQLAVYVNRTNRRGVRDQLFTANNLKKIKKIKKGF